jgi:hypothetical protein
MYSLIDCLRVQHTTAHSRPGDADGSDLFHAALRDPSNLEMEWLWLATQVTREDQRAYCLQQALHIDPSSELARRGLAQLAQSPGAPLDFKRWAQYASPVR